MGFAMAKFGLEPREAIPRRDCGFYVKYIFLFTSLIQFLIILGLVLFMVYGNAQGGTDTHLRLLEEQVQSHYRRIVTLSATNANLSRALNATLKDKDRLQGLALKVQRELEKCNSSQASSSSPQVGVSPRDLGWHVGDPNLFPVHFPQAEKLQLQRQLDQTTSSKKSLEETGQKTEAMLAKATQERDRCQQDLQSARTEGDLSRTELGLQRHECRSLKDDISDKLQRVMELAKLSRCGEAEDELRQIRDRTEGLFRWQQDRDSRYVRKNACELSVQQCHINCSREMQELEKRIQALEKREKDGKEERARLEANKEKLGKELEETRRAAAVQAESLREQLRVCMGAQVRSGDRHGNMGCHCWLGTGTSAPRFSSLTPGLSRHGDFPAGRCHH
uniref:PLVAP protein n=1 Tax=Malurus cyaneus samueli TaxID=2593467 RepID=A0A8C5X8V0_9PASS